MPCIQCFSRDHVLDSRLSPAKFTLLPNKFSRLLILSDKDSLSNTTTSDSCASSCTPLGNCWLYGIGNSPIMVEVLEVHVVQVGCH